MAKKIDKAKLEWLDEELRDLSGQGLIEESVAQRIRQHYEPAEEEPVLQPAAVVTVPAAQVEGVKKAGSAVVSGKQQYSLVVLVLLGAFMIGSGVVLLFAHNWDMLSVQQRVAAALVPVVLAACCGVYTIVKEKDSRWQETSAFFTATGFAVLTALVSQIYHTGGTMLDFTKLMLMVSLPLIYLFRSYMLTVVYCAALFVFLDYGYFDQRDGYMLYLAGIAPFILYYLFFQRPVGMRTAWMRYISLLPLVWLLARFSHRGLMGVNLFAVAGLLYLAGLYYSETKQGGWRNPWLPIGWFFLTILLLFGDSMFSYRRFAGYGLPLFWYAFMAVNIFVVTRRITPLKVIIAIVLLLQAAIFAYGMERDYVTLVTNISLLLLGVTALWEGTKARGLMKVNAGMLQIALLASVRFLDGRISILTRSLIFITIGIAFIVANVYLSRRFRSENLLAAPESEVKNDVEI